MELGRFTLKLGGIRDSRAFLCHYASRGTGPTLAFLQEFLLGLRGCPRAALKQAGCRDKRNSGYPRCERPASGPTPPGGFYGSARPDRGGLRLEQVVLAAMAGMRACHAKCSLHKKLNSYYEIKFPVQHNPFPPSARRAVASCSFVGLAYVPVRGSPHRGHSRAKGSNMKSFPEAEVSYKLTNTIVWSDSLWHGMPIV